MGFDNLDDMNRVISVEEAESENAFQKLLINFLYNEPFFASIIASLDKVKTRSIPTAGVACIKGEYYLYWNPDFIATLTFREFVGLMKHECYHIIFRHCTTRTRKPHNFANLAQDLAINSIIPYNELPKGGYTPTKYLLRKQQGVWKEDKTSEESIFVFSLPAEESFEYYFDKIMKNKQIFEKSEMQSAEGSGCCDSEPGDGDGDENPGSSGKGGFGFDSHFDSDELTDSEKKMADAKAKETIRKAIKKAKQSNSGRGWGNVPSKIREQLNSMFDSEVDWKAVLKYFCGSRMKANKHSSYKKINRKYPYIFPGKKKTHTSHIAIFIDQSGSVSDENLELLFGSLNELASLTQFTIYHFDTEVDKDSRYDWKKGQTLDKAYRTRYGGTSFKCVEKFFATIANEFDGYVVMTDGQAPKPPNSITKRCWLLIPGTELHFTPDNNDTVVKMKKEL